MQLGHPSVQGYSLSYDIYTPSTISHSHALDQASYIGCSIHLAIGALFTLFCQSLAGFEYARRAPITSKLLAGQFTAVPPLSWAVHECSRGKACSRQSPRLGSPCCCSAAGVGYCSELCRGRSLVWSGQRRQGVHQVVGEPRSHHQLTK